MRGFTTLLSLLVKQTSVFRPRWFLQSPWKDVPRRREARGRGGVLPIASRCDDSPISAVVTKRSRWSSGRWAWLTVGVLSTAGCGGESGTSSRASNPNVIVVVIDTLRADALPLYGNSRNTSPFLSRVAESGVVFDTAWSVSSWTAPATASILTSLHPFQHHVEKGYRAYQQHQSGDNEQTISLSRIPDSIETIAEAFHRQGYATFGIADNPNISPRMGFERGFDRFEMTEYKSAQRVNETLESWLEEIRGADSFFVYLHYMDPHMPYFHRAPWYEGSDPSLAKGTVVGESRRTDLEPPAAAAVKRARKGDLEPVKKFRQEALHAYESEILYVDFMIQNALELLNWEDAVVIVTSDHGEEFLDHGNIGHAFQLYNELLQVPMLVRLPGADAPRGRVEQPVSVLDVLPTARDAAGLPASAQDQGISLLPLMAGETGEQRTFLASRLHPFLAEYRYKRAVVDGKYKLIAETPDGPRELFDLDRDSRELRNLAKERKGFVQKMFGAMQSAMEALPEFEEATAEPVTLSEEQRELLEALGYTDN